ncbi:unnamed protein product [Somion occarium]|uniref:Uncharacterized protein n=1 Tax=Somion occarium TaxID=3059160 RepID=A0ABP1DXC8_9APHY
MLRSLSACANVSFFSCSSSGSVSSPHNLPLFATRRLVNHSGCFSISSGLTIHSRTRIFTLLVLGGTASVISVPRIRFVADLTLSGLGLAIPSMVVYKVLSCKGDIHQSCNVKMIRMVYLLTAPIWGTQDILLWTSWLWRRVVLIFRHCSQSKCGVVFGIGILAGKWSLAQALVENL